MATFNTSEILKAAHKSAKENAAFWVNRNTNGCKSYRDVLAYYMRLIWKQKKEVAAKAVEVIETFTIALDYSDFDARVTVKKMGGKWNADSKTWTVVCRKSDLGRLVSKIKSTSTRTSQSPKGVYNTGFGYYGTAADAKRGYDGIE